MPTCDTPHARYPRKLRNAVCVWSSVVEQMTILVQVNQSHTLLPPTWYILTVTKYKKKKGWCHFASWGPIRILHNTESYYSLSQIRVSWFHNILNWYRMHTMINILPIMWQPLHFLCSPLWWNLRYRIGWITKHRNFIHPCYTCLF